MRRLLDKEANSSDITKVRRLLDKQANHSDITKARRLLDKEANPSSMRLLDKQANPSRITKVRGLLDKKKLLTSLNKLNHFTHLIMDEIHERTAHSEFLLLIVPNMFQNRWQGSLVLFQTHSILILSSIKGGMFLLPLLLSRLRLALRK